MPTEGRYRTICADPPWQYRTTSPRAREIAAVPIQELRRFSGEGAP